MASAHRLHLQIVESCAPEQGRRHFGEPDRRWTLTWLIKPGIKPQQPRSTRGERLTLLSAVALQQQTLILMIFRPHLLNSRNITTFSVLLGSKLGCR